MRAPTDTHERAPSPSRLPIIDAEIQVSKEIQLHGLFDPDGKNLGYWRHLDTVLDEAADLGYNEVVIHAGGWWVLAQLEPEREIVPPEEA